MESKRPKPGMKYHIASYTREQKLVATVWYHERLYTGMSHEQLAVNFMIRFKCKYPKYSTLRIWEKKLFREGSLADKPISRSRLGLTRLIYVPYVKESLVRFPDLSLKARSQMLGIASPTLKTILKNDFTPDEIILLKSKKDTEKMEHLQKFDRECISKSAETSSFLGKNIDIEKQEDTLKDNNIEITTKPNKIVPPSKAKLFVESIETNSKINFVDVNNLATEK